MSKTPIIALLTDFGTADAYVGIMKGVIAGLCPSALCIDVTHAVAPQNVRQAAYLLATACPYFPAHTIFVVVVDPGVGTARRPIAVQTDHGTYIAPDNGVLSYALAHRQVSAAVTLSERRFQLPDASHTFHGRDIFSPAAAHLAAGVPLTALGPPIADWVTLAPPLLELAPDQIRGEVLHVDHFGNLISSIGPLRWLDGRRLQLQPAFGPAPVPADLAPILADSSAVLIGDQRIAGISRTYAEAAPGAIVALVGSSGQLEVGVNQGSAAQTLGLRPGDAITVIPRT